MPSTFAKSLVVPAALVALLFAVPAFAQSLPSSAQPSNAGDPFSGVAAVDSDQMSTVSGELAGGIGVRTSTRTESGESGDCGALCGGGASNTAVGATSTDVAASGNTTTINVTAINNQTTIIGPSFINTSGGINAATGGGATGTAN